MRRHSRMSAAPNRQRDRAAADSRVNDHGQGHKQRGNREAKKPKADKKIAPVNSTFLRPQVDAPKPGAKWPSK